MYELISIVACPAAELQLELTGNEYSQSFTVPREGLLTYVKLVHLSTKIINN